MKKILLDIISNEILLSRYNASGVTLMCDAPISQHDNVKIALLKKYGNELGEIFFSHGKVHIDIKFTEDEYDTFLKEINIQKHL